MLPARADPASTGPAEMPGQGLSDRASTAFGSGPGLAGTMPGQPGRSAQEVENWKMVLELNTWPAFSSVVGKLGWFGESGKCWVSKVYPSDCR